MSLSGLHRPRGHGPETRIILERDTDHVAESNSKAMDSAMRSAHRMGTVGQIGGQSAPVGARKRRGPISSKILHYAAGGVRE